MAKCKLCNKDSLLISSCLSLCVDCIRNDFKSALAYIQRTHAQARKTFNLPHQIPHDPDGKRCSLCVNACQVEPGKVGFCGLPLDLRQEASLSWYYDPLPTNCVADWVCKGSCDFGYKNLAVFYNACSFNCLFCQNWHFRETNLSKKISAFELAKKVDAGTACICYFGGDPTPQLPHSILTSRIARDLNKERTLRICWETNGSMSCQYLKEILELSLASDGCVKFDTFGDKPQCLSLGNQSRKPEGLKKDGLVALSVNTEYTQNKFRKQAPMLAIGVYECVDLKAWTESLNIALCGITNRQTLENFKFAATYIDKRPAPPLLVASTLLVPGYVDIDEVEKIAKFIASLNPSIPYSLLAFHPQFQIVDLPTTSRMHAERARDLALKAGLINVRIGNIHLLSDAYTV